MQVKHNKPTPEFQPIELTITIESAEEFKSLYGAINVSNDSMRKQATTLLPAINCGNDFTRSIYRALADIADERGYIK